MNYNRVVNCLWVKSQYYGVKHQPMVLNSPKDESCIAKKLNAFWNSVNGMPFSIKLDKLKTANHTVIFQRDKLKLAKIRNEFERKDKHKKLWGTPCFSCGGKANHRHHIIALAKGGDNRRTNIVPICGSCHAKIHPWLKSSTV